MYDPGANSGKFYHFKNVQNFKQRTWFKKKKKMPRENRSSLLSKNIPGDVAQIIGNAPYFFCLVDINHKKWNLSLFCVCKSAPSLPNTTKSQYVCGGVACL